MRRAPTADSCVPSAIPEPRPRMREESDVYGTNLDPCLWMDWVEVQPNEMRNDGMPSIGDTSTGAD